MRRMKAEPRLRGERDRLLRTELDVEALDSSRRLTVSVGIEICCPTERKGGSHHTGSCYRWTLECVRESLDLERLE